MRELEEEYMKKQSTFFIEEAILSSFSKEEMRVFNTEIENDYIKVMFPYTKDLALTLQKQELDEIGTYFIEQFYYFFLGGKELEMNKSFVRRFQNYYKLHHTDYFKESGFKNIDINSITITEIVGMYMKLPSNLRKNMKCPLHNDNTPSFRIYKNTNSFYCFGCHKGGNAVNFVAEKEGISTKEAFKKIINLYS